MKRQHEERALGQYRPLKQSGGTFLEGLGEREVPCHVVPEEPVVCGCSQVESYSQAAGKDKNVLHCEEMCGFEDMGKLVPEAP